MADSSTSSPPARSPQHTVGKPPPAGWVAVLREVLSRLAARVAEPFSREQIGASLKTLAWVVPLTLLIWVYAERDQLYTERDVVIPIDVRSTDPSRVVTLISPPEKRVLANLRGPRASVEGVSRSPREVLIDVPANIAGDEYQPGTLQELSEAKLFTDNGIILSNCNPSILKISIDEIVEREVTVQAPADLGVLDGPPVFEPPTVKVRGPSRVLKNAGKLVVYADMAALDVLKIPGQHPPVDGIRLKVPIQDPHVSLNPPVVRATIKVRQADVPYTIESVPIFIQGPLGVLDKYRVVIPSGLTLARVQVTGPQEQITQLASKTFLPYAILKIDAADQIQAQLTFRRTVSFYLPDGVAASSEDMKRTVEFSLQDRSAAP